MELNQLGLTRLTDAICEGKHLRGLHLARNALSDLPVQFGATLFNLCFLDLSFNDFSELPDCLGLLTNLIELKLSHNHLTVFPNALCTLTKLENLDLAHNQISLLPPLIGNLDALISLNLEKNLIAYLPAEIGKLKLLRHLNLDDCPLLMELPEFNRKGVPTLKELTSRVITRHSLPLPEALIPYEVIEQLQNPGCCSFCNGPFYEHHIKRYRFVNKGPYLVALEYRLCSIHWTNEKDRILSIFRPAPLTAPSKLEPGEIEEINRRINTQIRPKPIAWADGKPSMDSNLSALTPVVANPSNSNLHLGLFSPAASPSTLSVDSLSQQISSEAKAKPSSKKVKAKGKAPLQALPASTSSNPNVISGVGVKEERGGGKRRKASLTCSSNEIGGPIPSSSQTPFTQMEFIEEGMKMKHSTSSLFQRKERA